MIVSDRYKFIFVSVPKTATRSIHNLLLDIDETATKNHAVVDGQNVQIMEASTAKQIREYVGEFTFNIYKKFAFIRNPYSKIVSAYAFYSGSREVVVRKSFNRHKVVAKIKTMIAKILPFHLWAILYPYKSDIRHLCDDDGTILVDFIGRFENLESDLSKILTRIGVPTHEIKLRHTNRSTHGAIDSYFSNPVFMYILNQKIKKEIDFYRNIPEL